MQLEAWLPALFLLLAEMHIRSGGFKAVLP
jgi:hypothetical protein